MFINSIPQSQPTCSFQGNFNKAEVLRNKYKIMLTQDIWSPSLKVKMPETPEEKEVLLEVLKNRLKLDRFARLTNEHAGIIFKLNLIESLKKENPKSDELPKLIKELTSKGKLSSVLKTLEKNIEQEKLKNKDAVKYFKDIDYIEDEYIDKKFISYSQLEKFWHQIRKNNINSDNKLSTKEIISIVNKEINSAKVIKKSDKTAVNLNKKQAILKLERDYEENLRRYIDVYAESKEESTKNTIKSRDLVSNNNEELFKKYPELRKQLPNIFKTVEAKYKHKVHRVASQEMYPVGQIWLIMDNIEKLAQKSIANLKKCKNVLETNPNDEDSIRGVKYETGKLENLKKEWLEGLSGAVKYERENRARAMSIGMEEDYEYLVGKNQNVIGQTNFIQELKLKYNDITKTPWEEVFEIFL